MSVPNEDFQVAKEHLVSAIDNITEAQKVLDKLQAQWPPDSTDPDPNPEPPPVGDDTWAASRDYRMYPYTPTSIWNRPIGKGAQLVDAQLTKISNNHGIVGWDPEHICTDPSAPVKTLSVNDGDRALNGTKVRVPADMSHDGSWNGCWAFITEADPLQIVQGQILKLSRGGNPETNWTEPSRKLHLVNDEGSEGMHGGSRLSINGGSLRKGELPGDEPIHHALKINVYAFKFLSQTNNGYRWPATTADGYYKDQYQGTVPECRMGSLLTLPQDYNLEGIADPRARKVATCFRNYGVYIVDDTYWDAHCIPMENSAIGSEWPTDPGPFHEQLQQVISDLQVVNNNEAGQRCSGGGDPVAPNLFAPA